MTQLSKLTLLEQNFYKNYKTIFDNAIDIDYFNKLQPSSVVPDFRADFVQYLNEDLAEVYEKRFAGYSLFFFQHMIVKMLEEKFMKEKYEEDHSDYWASVMQDDQDQYYRQKSLSNY